VPDTTLETPHTLAPEGRQPARASRAGAGQPFARRYVWWLVALTVVVIAEAVLRWANTRPGYDPYGWLIWGYQTVHGGLDLGGAPSWKPFTFVFTVPYSLFGHYALHLWELTAVSTSLAGAVFGGRIAYRLTALPGERPGRTLPPIVAAIVGGAAVLGTQQYFHYVLSSQSDPMLVTVCLAAIDMFLCGRLGWAWWLGVLAGLGRPEVWAFTFFYGLWILWKRPSMRWMVVAGAVVTAFLWFGVPTITNGKPNVAGQLALKSPRELHKNKVVGTIDRFVALEYLPVWIAALAAVGLAALRRNRVVLALAGMAVWWVVVEIAFVLHGFPGVPRYLFEPAALSAVLAGVAAGWLLQDTSRLHPRVPGWAGIPLVVILVAVCLPHARSLWDGEHKDIAHERLRTQRILQLGSYVTALGGPSRIQGCGGALLNVEYVSIMGWYLHKNTGQVAYQPLKVLKRSNPVTYFILLGNGWMVQPLRAQRAKARGCASLKSLYVPTARHPQGVLIPK
jgi:hypothetical protein